MSKCNDNVSEICNKLADKHDLNVTVVRDLVEDLRRMVFNKSKGGTCAGVDIYRALKGEVPLFTEELPRRRRNQYTRKPAKPARKRG